MLRRVVQFGLSVWLSGLTLAAAADKPRLVVDAGGHTARVNGLVFTKDGKYLVSAGNDKAIRIWDLASGQTVRTIRGWIGVGHEGNIYALALSPDNRYLAVGGWMGQPTVHGGRGGSYESYEKVNAIRIFDFQTGELLKTLEGNDGVANQLAFTSDKNYLISGGPFGKICVWLVTPEQMKRVHSFGQHKRGIEEIAISAVDTTVASLSFDGSMKIWDAATGLLIRGIGRQKRIAASPDGRYLISLTDDNRLLAWNFKDGEFVRELTRIEGDVDSISYIANGTRLLVIGAGQSKVLAADSGEIITTLKDITEQITTTAIATDGNFIAGALKESNGISIWNLGNGSLVKKLGAGGLPFYAVGFSKDGRAIAFGRELNENGLNNRGPLQSAFRFAQGDSYQVSFESRINVQSEFTRAKDTSGDLAIRPKESAANVLEIIKSGRISGEIKTGNDFSCYTLTADGRYIVVGTYEGNLEVYKTESPRLAFLFGRKDQDLVGHEGSVWAVAASPDNRTVISASADHTLRLWDIESGTNILTMFVGPDNEWVAWTPEGYYTSSLNGDRYLGWHASRGTSKNADYYQAAQFQKQYYRPGVVAQYLKSRDIKVAIQQESLSAGRPLPPPEPEITSGPAIDVTTIVPPVVYFITPEDVESAVDDEYLVVRAVAKAAENTLPVSQIQVFINGTEVRSKKDSRQELEVDVRVQLQSGQNELLVVAQNEKASSRPVTRKIFYTGKNQKNALPNLRILAIGVSKYQHPDFTLKFADKDAIDVAAIFKAQENLHLVINKVYSKTILNEQATRAAIIEGLDWLTNPNEVRSGDLILLFLSGHGGISRDNYYFYTYNHDPQSNPERDDIRWNILVDGLTRVPGTKPILFVDTCRAGAATGGVQGLTQALKELRINHPGVFFFAASSSDENSLEIDSLQHGAFTYFLLEGLRGEADKMLTDRLIYVDELGNWIRAKQGTYGEPPKELFQRFPLLALPRQ